MDVSVVVVTYNPDYKKLFSTLKSIICQKDVDFEIVIADDGSKSFDEKKIREWLQEKQFDQYTIVANPVNQGTMKNAFSGWKASSGDYIKQLSPGDMLFSEYSLCNALKTVKELGLSTAFGLAASYTIVEDEVQLSSIQNPVNLGPYYQKCTNDIMLNYVCLRDYANGMAFISKKDVLLKYGLMLIDKVKYAEDCTYILIAANEPSFGFIDDYIIWYERGEGISTQGSQIWNERIFNDNKACFKLLSDMNSLFKGAYISMGNYNDNIIGKLWTKIYRKIYKQLIKLKLKNNKNDIRFDKKIDNIEYLYNLLDKNK